MLQICIVAALFVACSPTCYAAMVYGSSVKTSPYVGLSGNLSDVAHLMKDQVKMLCAVYGYIILQQVIGCGRTTGRPCQRVDLGWSAHASRVASGRSQTRKPDACTHESQPTPVHDELCLCRHSAAMLADDRHADHRQRQRV